MKECWLCKLVSLITPSGDSRVLYFEKKRTHTLPRGLLPWEVAAPYYKKWMDSPFFPPSFSVQCCFLSSTDQLTVCRQQYCLLYPPYPGLSAAPKALRAAKFRAERRCERMNEMSVKPGVPAAWECENKETQRLQEFEKCHVLFLLSMFNWKI